MHQINNLRKIGLAFVMLLAVTIGTTLTAKADQVTISGASDPNLQATISITSLSATSITFSVSNLLVAGVTSTLTSVGFELPGPVPVTANSPGICTGDCFNFTATPIISNAPGNVPQFNSAVLDWAVLTGPSFAGSNPPGIGQGQTATFTVTGDFTGLTQADFLAGVYVRFQSVVDPAFPNVTSDVGHTPGTAVPEPASMLLLGTGLFGFGVAIRRRRKATK